MPEYWDNIRIQHLHDTQENWEEKWHDPENPFIPEAGEIVIYDVDTTVKPPQDRPRLKIGDGKTTVTDLPFAAAETVTVNPGTENRKEYKIVTTTNEDAEGEDGVITIVLY